MIVKLLLIATCIGTSLAFSLFCQDIPEFKQDILCKYLTAEECSYDRERFWEDCRRSCNFCGQPKYLTTKPTTTKSTTTVTTKATPKPTPKSTTKSTTTKSTTKSTTTKSTTASTTIGLRESPQWLEWKPWSSCSKTCGEGNSFKVRERLCSSGTAKDCIEPGKVRKKQKIRCRILPCAAEWSEWKPTKCTPSCGPGIITKTRTCSQVGKCIGADSMVEQCFTKCPEIETLDWSACSTTCGHGHRFRYINCTTEDKSGCERQWGDCQEEECPTIQCVGQQHRYTTKSKCCENAIGQLCGQGGASERIIGGTLAKTWPWMGHMLIPRPAGTELCGISLIHKEWGITAAHCVHNKEIKGRPMQVVLGADTLQDRTGNVQLFQPSEIIVHPEFNDSLVADIALIKLDKPADINSRVNTICLPNGEFTTPDTTCVAAGWGLTDYTVLRASNDLMEVNLFVYPYETCRRRFSGTKFAPSLDGRQICAGRLSGGADTCSGDSGGPLMCQRCGSCNWYLAGLTSFGSTQCGTPDSPGVYCNVLSFHDWILENIPDVEAGEFNCLSK